LLKRFIYLDEDALAGYTASIEDGLLGQKVTREVKSGSAGGSIGYDKIAKADLKRGKEHEESKTVSDAPAAQFDRLVKIGEDNPDEVGWIDVMDPDADFATAAIGNFISWDCDVFIPDISRLISKSGDAARLLPLVPDMLELMRLSGKDIDDSKIPDVAAIDRVTSFVNRLEAKRVVVGEDEDTEWKVSGSIHDRFVHADDIDDRLIIVGKVTRKLSPAQTRPYVMPPTINRQQRKALERKKPESGKEDQYLFGPALLLDVLAIYR
jgi:hypothetical protein